MNQLDTNSIPDINVDDNGKDDAVHGKSSFTGFDRYGFFGGKEYTDPKEEPRLSTRVLHSREMKWRSMCLNWESYWKNHRLKVRDRCRKGIPDSMRCEAWQRLCCSPMVLVARTKVIVRESQPDVTKNASISDILKNVLDKSFSTESANSKRTSSIITTSPSFRIKRSNAESRRKMILHKLYGSVHNSRTADGTALLINEHTSSSGISSHWRDSANSTSGIRCSDASLADEARYAKDSRAFYSSQPCCSNAIPYTVNSQDSESSTEDLVMPSSSERQDATLTHDYGLPDDCNSAASKSSTHILGSIAVHISDSNNPDLAAYPVMSPSSPMCRPAGDLHLPPLANKTTAIPYGYNTISNFDVLRTAVSTITAATGAPAVAAASSSSGGYASLSTDSGDGGFGVHEETGNNSILSGCHDDQYSVASYFSSRSSTSSIFWRSIGRRSRRKPISTNALDKVSSISLHDTLLVGDNNRATLMPLGDPDPVELYYQYCSAEGQPAVCDQIRRDIDRQFPFHELFHQKGGHGQESMYTLLKAYSVRHPDKGYCQGQAPLAAVLLMFMPEADAFWTFNEICERYLNAYYDDGLERVQIDAQILFTLLKGSYADVYKFLKKHSIDPILIVLEWFLCAFTRTLPWAVVLRVLDMFFCEGKVVLFRVGLVLLRRMFGTISQRRECNAMDEILLRVRDIQSVVKNTDEFVQETLHVGLTPRDLAQEAIRHSRLWAKKKLANSQP